MRACVRACMRACMQASARACMLMRSHGSEGSPPKAAPCAARDAGERARTRGRRVHEGAVCVDAAAEDSPVDPHWMGQPLPLVRAQQRTEEGCGQPLCLVTKVEQVPCVRKLLGCGHAFGGEEAPSPIDIEGVFPWRAQASWHGCWAPRWHQRLQPAPPPGLGQPQQPSLNPLPQPHPPTESACRHLLLLLKSACWRCCARVRPSSSSLSTLGWKRTPAACGNHTWEAGR